MMGARGERTLFLVTILLGSFLLFLVQPMIARMALPRLGGAPAVWNSAMLVYQALLLGGYAYAHWLSKLAPPVQRWLHLGAFALAAVTLPVGLSGATPPPGASPALWVPWLLLLSIGPLFFVVSAQAPLMQRWYALGGEARDPYPLYAASNFGSFAGLISYPLLVEPSLTLRQQSLGWSVVYVALFALVALCAFKLPRSAAPATEAAASEPLGWRRILLWIGLAAIPSGLMLSTTTHLTTDIVAMPLLWVLPLGLYLLSFTVAFAARRGLADALTVAAPLLILIAGGFAFADASRNALLQAGLGLVLLFTVAVALHGEMYRTRPAPERLTGFYLAMSVGGVLGGLFCALVAPTLFDWTYEHPLLILAAALLVPQRPLFSWLKRLWEGTGGFRAELLVLFAILVLTLVSGEVFPDLPETTKRIAVIATALLAVMLIGRRIPYSLALLALMLSFGGWSVLRASAAGTRERSYFGVYTTDVRSDGSAIVLSHGTTMHGMQSLRPGEARLPTTYYAARSAVGLALANATELFGANASVGVVGLGTGTLSCYKQPGQSWTFFEIDPAVVGIARGAREGGGGFSFLRRCAPDARIILGDARLMLARERPASYDALAIDAFSSDAVPMHLLTREAFAVYRRALKPGGLLLVHISNRYLELQPVLSSIAKRDNWSAALRDHALTREEERANASRSLWVAMAPRSTTVNRLIAASVEEEWLPLDERKGFTPWTDDYSTILPLLKFPALFED